MMEQKGKWYQGVRTIKVFAYKNTRSDFKCCDYWERWKTIRTATQGAFSDKIAPDIDVFTDEPVVQCDIQVVESTSLADSK